MVDLPGYGFAHASKTDKEKWELFIRKYLAQRENLYCIFVLIDSRHEPQKIDLEFMQWLGENEIPFVIVFTKTDKLKKMKLSGFMQEYADKLMEYWEQIPEMFVSSSETGAGREEILAFIERVNKM